MNDLSEKEQLDELRAWWQENRGMVLGGIALGIALILGFRMFTQHEVNQAVEASARYEQLIDAVADNDLEPAREVATTLFDEYDGTVYADQARLAMARLYMDLGRDADAADVLRPLAEAGGEEPLALVAKLRLGRILLYQDKPGEALALLDVPADTAFVARFQETIGDAHYALGNMEEARTAWTAALADAQLAQTVDADLVRMKLDDLPEAGAAADEPLPAAAPPDAADDEVGDTDDNEADGEAGEATEQPADDAASAVGEEQE